MLDILITVSVWRLRFQLGAYRADQGEQPMSTPIESFAAVTTRYQEAAATALRTWTDGLHTFTGGDAGLPDAKAMAKQYFDAVQQVLDTQRRFTEALFTVADTARTVSDQAVQAV